MMNKRETLSPEEKARIIEGLKQNPAIQAAIAEGATIDFSEVTNTEIGEAAVRAAITPKDPARPQWFVDQRENEKRLRAWREGRTIAGADVNDGLKRADRRGFQHRAIKDSGYGAHEGEPFVRRAVGKVKGKAAKKAAKRARHRERARIGNAVATPGEVHEQEAEGQDHRQEGNPAGAETPASSEQASPRPPQEGT